MSKTLAEWIKEITEWQDRTFTEATPLSAATHLQREVRELIFDLASGNPKSMRFEIVDCFLLIIGVAHLSGVDLEEALEKKMTINKARKWGKPDAQGVVEHIRDEPFPGSDFPTSEGSRFVGKTLLQVFEEEGILPEDTENILLKISKEDSDGLLQAD